MATARYYNEDKDDGTQVIYGVPRRDISDAEYKALSPLLKQQVDDSPLYRKTNPNPQPKKASPDAVGRAEKGASDSKDTGAADDTHNIDKGDKEA